jgi:very-short-patch-repair endonuclease
VNMSTRLAAQGGVASVATLINLGSTPGEIRWAVKSGRLRQIRKGWLRTTDADPLVVRSVAAGGRLGCISALAHFGLWVPRHDKLHVSLPHHAGRYALSDVVPHWEGVKWRSRRSPIESITTVLRQVISCCDRETAVAVLDSALHKHKVTPESFSQIVRSLPQETRSLLVAVDRNSESGYETLCRVRLARFGAAIRSQVRLEGIGRVDLLIGDRLIVEADGKEWHDDPESFLTDRARDLAAHRQGYATLRLAPYHVDFEWPWVESVVASIINRGEHLWSARQLRHRANNSFGG